MTTFIQETQACVTSGYIELFEIDTTNIGGADVYRFTPESYSASVVLWQGNVYSPFPIQVEGFEWNGSTSAPPKPTLTISNVNKFMLAAVIDLGDLVGAKVTRWRTFKRFLDGQVDADSSAHFPPDRLLIEQKAMHDKTMFQWSLISPMDREGLMLPRRQILKDETSIGVYFPGVSRTRI
jgi:lambda family phage minor tail protein L